MFFINLSIAVVMKYAIVFLMTYIICKSVKSIGESYVMGWVFTQLIIMMGMMVLSVFKGMTRTGMLVFLLVVCLILLIYIYKSKTKWQKEKICVNKEVLSTYNIIATVGFMALATYVVVHSFYYFDCMTDAYCY